MQSVAVAIRPQNRKKPGQAGPSNTSYRKAPSLLGCFAYTTIFPLSDFSPCRSQPHSYISHQLALLSSPHRFTITATIQLSLLFLFICLSQCLEAQNPSHLSHCDRLCHVTVSLSILPGFGCLFCVHCTVQVIVSASTRVDQTTCKAFIHNAQKDQATGKAQ